MKSANKSIIYFESGKAAHRMKETEKMMKHKNQTQKHKHKHQWQKLRRTIVLGQASHNLVNIHDNIMHYSVKTWKATVEMVVVSQMRRCARQARSCSVQGTHSETDASTWVHSVAVLRLVTVGSTPGKTVVRVLYDISRQCRRLFSLQFSFSLQFYTGCLPMHLILEQQMILFYRHVLKSSNVILQTLLCLKQRSVNSLTSLYSIRSLNASCSVIKQCIWEYNVRNAANTSFIIAIRAVLCLYVFLCVYISELLLA